MSFLFICIIKIFNLYKCVFKCFSLLFECLVHKKCCVVRRIVYYFWQIFQLCVIICLPIFRCECFHISPCIVVYIGNIPFAITGKVYWYCIHATPIVILIFHYFVGHKTFNSHLIQINNIASFLNSNNWYQLLNKKSYDFKFLIVTGICVWKC